MTPTLPTHIQTRAQHAANMAGYPYVVWSPVPGQYAFAPALEKDMAKESKRMQECDGIIIEPSE